ncbi:MAG TPA: hypothetical protein VJM49_18650, partial [Acidimicrobiales bacterium]|nr:hypothetical protein [Acidimicrobiales bacterium]
HVEEGRLTIYAVGIERAVKRRHWRAVPEANDPTASWIEPTQGAVPPHLIEKIVVEAARPPGRDGPEAS